MKKAIKTGISSLLVLGMVTACGRVDNNLLMDDSALNPNNEMNLSNDFNALGQSTKQFTISFRANPTPAEIKTLEEKYNAKIQRIIPQIGVAIVEQNETESTGVALEVMAKSMSSERTLEATEPVNMVKLEKVKVNDPQVGKQYHLDVTNTMDAWEVTMGSPKVKIAIVDTGMDLNHPDLKNKIVEGKNIVEPMKKPIDDNGHGTHVAGIAAAQGNNSIGVSGIAPGCALMPVKVLKAGRGTDVDIAEGIVWATDKGADVINISIGLYTKSTAMEKAVRYAIAKNVVVVSSAGNEFKSSKIHLPSMIKGVIEVSASNKYDRFASFSNYDQQISVAAPGDGILSTLPTYTVELSKESGKNYGVMSGTSMASPMVAGLAALLKSKNRSMTPAEIKKKIETGSVDLGKTGYDVYFGHGRIDVANTIGTKTVL